MLLAYFPGCAKREIFHAVCFDFKWKLLYLAPDPELLQKPLQLYIRPSISFYLPVNLFRLINLKLFRIKLHLLYRRGDIPINVNPSEYKKL